MAPPTKKQKSMAKAQMARWPGGKLAKLLPPPPLRMMRRPPVRHGSVRCRTMYLSHLGAICRTGRSMKPSEGVHKALATRVKKLIDESPGKHGIWLWVCSSKKDDDTPGVPRTQKQSFVRGAVFVTGVLDTKEIVEARPSKKGRKSLLSPIRHMQEFKHSQHLDCQLIVPMHPSCRLLLKKLIPLHKELLRQGEDPRASGLWRPLKGTEVYKALARAEFV